MNRFCKHRGCVLFVLSLLIGLLTSTARAALENRYTFNFASVEDSVGGQDGVLIDPAGIAYYAGGEIHLSNNDNANSNQDFTSPGAVGAYVDLPNYLISDAANNGDFYEFSVEFWATVQENRDWSQMGSFGNSNNGEDTSVSGDASDYLVIAPQSGLMVDPNTEIEGNYFVAATHSVTGQEDRVPDPNGPLSTGVEHHVVVSVDQYDTTAGANGTLRLFLDGSLVSTGPVEDEGFIDFTYIDDYNNWLGRSPWPDALFDGSFNEFSVYSHALDATEVSANFAAGPVIDPPIALPTLTVNREDGTVTVMNETGAQLSLLSYSIASESGSLDPVSWTSINTGGFDPDGTWTPTSSTAELLAEGTTGDGGQISAMSSESIGAAWNPSPFEDLIFTYTLAGGTTANGQVTYTGYDGPIAAADLNADGMIDPDDFYAFAAAMHTDLSGMSPYELYVNGDMDGDGDNDYVDFRIFKADYIAANSAEEFVALLATVPEPSGLLLAVCCLFPLAYRRG